MDDNVGVEGHAADGIYDNEERDVFQQIPMMSMTLMILMPISGYCHVGWFKVV